MPLFKGHHPTNLNLLSLGIYLCSKKYAFIDTKSKYLPKYYTDRVLQNLVQRDCLSNIKSKPM
ncbi:MAG: hypothetical protein PF445_12545 [Melioribacteraceae bacterium]|jgi:hypothetical protein|nr:hypothetical protein [Melioribacteraceae bacterium]